MSERFWLGTLTAIAGGTRLGARLLGADGDPSDDHGHHVFAARARSAG